MFIIHLLNIPLRMMFCLLTIDEIQAPCFGELVNLGASDSDKKFFRKLMGYWLSCGMLALDAVSLRAKTFFKHTFFSLSVFEELESTKGSCAR